MLTSSFSSAKARNFTSATKEERLVRSEFIDIVIYGTKEGSPSGSKKTHNFNFSRTSTSNEVKRTVFFSLEKTVGSVDHDRTLESYIFKMKRKGYDTFLYNIGPF